MDQSELKENLQRIQQILISHQSVHNDFIASLLGLCDTDLQAFYREVNSKRFWGGAGSVANEALADNPGIEEWIWQSDIQSFRELMIDLGQHLMGRGGWLSGYWFLVVGI